MARVYRKPVDDKGDWLPFIRATRNLSGVYIVRDKRTKECLYIGESHTGRLYDTLTRHFQHWEGPTAGVTLSRQSVEVAVETMPPSAAASYQYKLIKRLKPALNQVGRPSTGKEPKYNADDFRD